MRDRALRSTVLVRVAALGVGALALVAITATFGPQVATPVRVVGLVVAVLAGVALLSFGVGRILAVTVWDPLDRISTDVEAVAVGDDESREVAVSGGSELRLLAKRVNRMAERLVREQKLLAENVESLAHANRELAQAHRQLAHADKLASVGRLAAGIAHEVGNPLGALVGYLEVAKRRGVADEAWLDDVTREVDRIDRIIRGMLDFARPKSPSAERLTVNDTVRSAVDVLERQGRFKTTRLRLELAEPSPTVAADPAQLEQVLVNLLLNACDAVGETKPEGHVTVRTGEGRYARTEEPAPRRREDPPGVDYSHLRNGASPAHGNGASPRAGQRVVRLEVRDNGPGLRAKTLDRVFEPFYTTKQPGRGTGLGLAVSRRLVEGMGGTISATSQPGRGTQFAAILPCEPGLLGKSPTEENG